MRMKKENSFGSSFFIGQKNLPSKKLASPCLQGEGDHDSGGRGWYVEK
mgnify:CR=1 FL=1